MWLLLVLFTIFISVKTLFILNPCQRTYYSRWTQGNLGSSFSIDPQAIIHNESIIRTTSIKCLCFISTMPVPFIHSTIKFCKYYFVFISFIITFHIILYYFKETPPRQLFPGAIPWRGTNTSNSVIRGSGVTLNHTNPIFGSVSTLVIPSRLRWSRASNPFVWLSPGKKRRGLTNYFLYVFDGVFHHGWYGF